MRQLISISIITILFSTSSAYAKRTSAKKYSKAITSKSKFDIRKPMKRWVKSLNDGFRFGVSTGTMNANLKARITGAEASENDSNSSFQVQVGHEKIKLKGLGHSTFLVYQNGSFSGESARHMRINGNATYGLTKQVYTYGGLNFGKFYGPGYLENSFDAGFGYQAGLGLKFHKRANIEIEYLNLSSEGRKNKVNYDLNARGVMVKLNTPFSFNI